eukprot:CAMPEP_0197841304 /NCGR_PEP_ID=MMETSP1437-20131217/46096_1 /TAXON_ID=49252 ORGANISM="Eucampia antarctica, Strain CCMP1452" /NCGR_SAMPLE_ID=MMETSP1437 /ASSEMBLY_ACC=CAM_ASM_001096 /LENGTH=877 /DNA_ID=CAMNT_0043451031 /DNA_START=75 /DNA_END=2708 /DNA_ORIENTATION=+
MMSRRALLQHRRFLNTSIQKSKEIKRNQSNIYKIFSADTGQRRDGFDTSSTGAASALLLTLCTIAYATNSNENPSLHDINRTLCDTAMHHDWKNRAASKLPPNVTIQREITKSSPPRNVMLHRMRSVRARDMKDKYKIDWDKVLGEGAYGSVHPGWILSTGEKVAFKKISKRFTNTSAFRTETAALLRLFDNGGHPNISGLRDIYEDYDYFYLVMDLVAGGEMFDHLINYGAYSEADAARLMHEVASALAFLHGVGVIHADMKPENLLLCSLNQSDGTIQIIDFGCAKVLQDNYHDDDDDNEEYLDTQMRPKNKITESDFQSSTGTTAYWPPERFQPGATPETSSDMWAVGVILFIMLTGVHPFDLKGTSTDGEIEEQIRKDPSPPITPELTSHLSDSAIDLIKKLMTKDPKIRITADELLRHPWISGDEATTQKIEQSGEKLSKFKDLRAKLEAGIFAILVDSGNRQMPLTEYAPTAYYNDKDDYDSKAGNSAAHIMKRAFEVFDAEGKGFVNEADFGRVVNLTTGANPSESDQKDFLAVTGTKSGLTLSDFSKLFAGIRHKHFQRGHIIFHTGDTGEAMYFINSGKVEIRTKKGKMVQILRQGDFFGEGCLLENHTTRFSTARCATPVDVIEIKRSDFEKYITNSPSTKTTLKYKWKARTLADAKSIIRLQTNVKERVFKEGEVVYKEGDRGNSMYFVDEKGGGELQVYHYEQPVHRYQEGESFGESSLLFERPRSSTVVCASETCKLHEMLGSDFLAFLETSPGTGDSLRNMCRKRLIKKAVKKFSLEKKRGLTNDDLIRAFQEIGVDKSGRISFDELRCFMNKMDPSMPDSEIVKLMDFVDVDEDGFLDFKDFTRLFRSFEFASYHESKKARN